MMGTARQWNFDGMFSRFDTIPECHGQTDGENCISELVNEYRRTMRALDCPL